MGRNPAFGRLPASDRLQQWWDAKSRVWRTNLLISVAVACVVLGLMLAATAGDADRVKPRVNSARPPTTVTTLSKPLSTVVVGDLRADGAPPAPTTSTSVTTTTAVAVSTTTPTTRATTPSSTVPQVPATTVPTSVVIFSDPVIPSTTTTMPPVTVAPVTTLPTTTTVAPVTTSTTKPGAVLPLGLPSVLGPG